MNISNYCSISNVQIAIEIKKRDKINFIKETANDIGENILIVANNMKNLERQDSSDGESYNTSLYYFNYIKTCVSKLNKMNSEQYLSKNGLLIDDIESIELPELISQVAELEERIFKICQKLAPELNPLFPAKLSDVTVSTIRKKPEQAEKIKLTFQQIKNMR
jgi:hypothetical protein